MNGLILSYFDSIYGPRVVLKAPDTISNEQIDGITALIDLYREGFFLHTFGSYKSANLLFNIPSKIARGGEILVLMSIIMMEAELDLDVCKVYLEEFVNRLNEIEEPFHAFYKGTKYESGKSREKAKILNRIFHEIYDLLPHEVVKLEKKDLNIMLFGSPEFPKKNLIKNMLSIYSKEILPNLSPKQAKYIPQTLSFSTQEILEPITYSEFLKSRLREQNGLIFTMSWRSMETEFMLLEQFLFDVTCSDGLEKLPIMILIKDTTNESTNKELSEKKELIKRICNDRISLFIIDNNSKNTLLSALSWFIEEIGTQFVPPPTPSKTGIALFHWSESELITDYYYPEGVIPNPDRIAHRCFSIFKYIVKGEPKRFFFVLPFVEFDAKAAIYFDYTYGYDVSTSASPLCLVVYFRDKIPTVLIKQFNTFIFDEFLHIKQNIKSTQKINQGIKKIHGEILSKMKSTNFSYEAVKIAELRYQALFRSAVDAILIIDYNSGICVDANTKIEQLLGREITEIIGYHVSQLNISEIYKQIKYQHEYQKKESGSHPFLVRIKNSKGSQIPVEISASVLNIGG